MPDAIASALFLPACSEAVGEAGEKAQEKADSSLRSE
jgi:hypothetical protein